MCSQVCNLRQFSITLTYHIRKVQVKALDGADVERQAPATVPPERTVQEGGWTSEFVWTGAGYLASTEIRPPNSLARGALTFFPSQKVGLGPYS